MELVSNDECASADIYTSSIDSMSMIEIKDHLANLNAALDTKDMVIQNLTDELAVNKASMMAEIDSFNALMERKT